MAAYREVLFELVDGHAATRLFQALSAERSGRARLQALAIGQDLVTVLIDYVGPAHAVARLRDVIQTKPDGTIVDFDVLIDSDKQLRVVASWTRPGASAQGVSLEHLLHDHCGPRGLLFGRVVEGVIAYKAASPNGAGLAEFLAAAQRAFGRRYTVRALRTGAFKPGWEIEEDRSSMDPDEEALLATALAAGYYDEPKRCGVRELGDALGVSKSVVARRLRSLERRALENLAQ